MALYKHYIRNKASPAVVSLSVAMARAFSSWSSQWSCSSLRVEARSWPSTSAALFLLVTARRSRSAASLIFSSRWISCLSRARASSRRCWNTGSSRSPSGKPRKHPPYRNVSYAKIVDSGYVSHARYAGCLRGTTLATSVQWQTTLRQSLAHDHRLFKVAFKHISACKRGWKGYIVLLSKADKNI